MNERQKNQHERKQNGPQEESAFQMEEECWDIRIPAHLIAEELEEERGS